MFAVWAFASAALARTWTTITGEHFEAEFVRVEGVNGIFQVKEKDYPYPLKRLIAADRLLVGRTLNHPPEVASIACTVFLDHLASFCQHTKPVPAIAQVHSYRGFAEFIFCCFIRLRAYRNALRAALSAFSSNLVRCCGLATRHAMQ